MHRVKVLPKEVQTEFTLPFPGEARSFVNVGDKVKRGQPLYEYLRNSIVDSYYLPKILGIKAEHAIDYVGRISGEFVTKGELLAEKISGGGLVGKRVVSGKDGVISLSRIHQGYIDLLGAQEEMSVESRINGVVKGITLGSQMIIESSAGQIDCMYGLNLSAGKDELTGEVAGEIALIEDGSSVYSTKSLKGDYSNMIVYAGKFAYSDVVREIYKRGAVAVVVYSMDYDDFKSLNVPIVLIGGFGQLRVNQEIEIVFQQCAGRYCKIDQENNRVLIANVAGISSEKFKGLLYFAPTVLEGQMVSINTPEHFGSIGAVIESYSDDKNEIVVQIDQNKRVVVEKDSVDLYTPYPIK